VIPAIDPSFATAGPEWQVGPAAPPQAGGPAAGGASFSGVLGRQIERLGELQGEAAGASRALATGQATDPTSVVMAVERARLAMQVAGQLRTKGVEAINDVFRTQV
jgi:flagellar hook-basal body complex protein FliE